MQTFTRAVVLAVVMALGFAGAHPARAAGDGYSHHVVFHVDENDAGKMNLVLNNAANVVAYYQNQGQKVQIEVVTYGPGLTMLRSDKSPVKERLASYTLEYPDVGFAACGNTMAKMAKKEGATPPIIQDDRIKVVPSGVVQIMMRQDQGWHYIRP